MRKLGMMFGVLLVAGCVHDSADYEVRSNPSDKIAIVGDIPGDVAIDLTVIWQTTVVDDACAPKMSWPVGIRFPKRVSFPVHLESRNGSQSTWMTWWDLLAPGRCGWQLAGIEFKADRSATDYSAHVDSIAPSRIAFVCIADCVANSPRMNDDPSQPVRQYCKFSVVGSGGAMFNPCVFASNGKLAGPDAVAFKAQHILRPGQDLVQFSLTDVDSAAGSRR